LRLARDARFYKAGTMNAIACNERLAVKKICDAAHIFLFLFPASSYASFCFKQHKNNARPVSINCQY